MVGLAKHIYHEVHLFWQTASQQGEEVCYFILKGENSMKHNENSQEVDN